MSHAYLIGGRTSQLGQGHGLLAQLVSATVKLSACLMCFLTKRRTRRALEALDPAVLEDIGVPHENPALRAGALERYPDLIKPRAI